MMSRVNMYMSRVNMYMSRVNMYMRCVDTEMCRHMNLTCVDIRCVDITCYVDITCVECQRKCTLVLTCCLLRCIALHVAGRVSAGIVTSSETLKDPSKLAVRLHTPTHTRMHAHKDFLLQSH